MLPVSIIKDYYTILNFLKIINLILSFMLWGKIGLLWGVNLPRAPPPLFPRSALPHSLSSSFDFAFLILGSSGIPVRGLERVGFGVGWGYCPVSTCRMCRRGGESSEN